MNKKLLAILTLVILAAALMLGGCGSSNDKEITFTAWGASPSEVAALDETIAAFTAKTGIKVKKEVIQDKYMDVLKARFSANNPPDVMYLDSFEVPALLKSGVLEDVGAQIDNKDDFYPILLNAFKDQDGKYYGVPKDYSTLALYVNTKLLESAGYKVADIPKDMVGFLAFAKQLQTKLPKGTAAVVFDRELARNLSALDASGATVVKADGKADFTSNQNALNYLQMFIDGKKGGYTMNAKDDLGLDWAGAAFGAEKAVFMMEGNWVLSALKKDYATVKYQILEMPTVNGKQQTMAFTVAYAVPKGAKNKPAAYEFVKYMTGEGQKIWTSASGTLPSRISVTKELKLEDDPDKKVHILGAAYATVWERGVTLPVINSAFGNQYQAALGGQKTLLDAMKAAEKEANDEIERQK
ncbi:MAG: extracellular solute-binding protein [Bacillota bacterium]